MNGSVTVDLTPTSYHVADFWSIQLQKKVAFHHCRLGFVVPAQQQQKAMRMSQPQVVDKKNPAIHTHQTRIQAGLNSVPNVDGKSPNFYGTGGVITPIKWRRLRHRTLTQYELQNFLQPHTVDPRPVGYGVLGGSYSIIKRDGTLVALSFLDFDDFETAHSFEATVQQDASLWHEYQQLLRERTKRGRHIAAYVPAIYRNKWLASQRDVMGKPRPIIELKNYFLRCYPSRGIELLHGAWEHVPVTTVNVWDALIRIANSLDTAHTTRLNPQDLRQEIPPDTPTIKSTFTEKRSNRRRYPRAPLLGIFCDSHTPVLTDVLERLQPFDSQRALAQQCGITVAPGVAFRCGCGNHKQADEHPSAVWLAATETHRYPRLYCHTTATSWTLADQYRQQQGSSMSLKKETDEQGNTRNHVHLHALWTCKLGEDAGVLKPKTLRTLQLPADAPPDARRLWNLFQRIRHLRAHFLPHDDPLPFSRAFVQDNDEEIATWTSHRLKLAFGFLTSRGYLLLAGRTTNKTPLWRQGAKRLVAARQDASIAYSDHENVASVQATVLPPAPERRPGQKDLQVCTTCGVISNHLDGQCIHCRHRGDVSWLVPFAAGPPQAPASQVATP